MSDLPQPASDENLAEARRVSEGITAAPVPANVQQYMRRGPSMDEGDTIGPPLSFDGGIPPEDQTDTAAGAANQPRGFERVNYQGSLEEARMEGYSWPEINDHIAQGTAAAAAEGYTPREIDQFLGRGTPEDGAQRMQGEWQSRIAKDESVATGLSSASTDVPITPLEYPSAARIADHAGQDAPDPTMPGPDHETPPSGMETDDQGARNAYRDALNAGQVRTPQDFAERYMGAAWKAASAAGIDPDPHALTRAAGELASSLPSNEELTDQAIRIAGQTGSNDVSTIKSNIVDDWAGGTPVAEIAKAASDDPSYAARLTRDDTPPNILGDLAGALKDMGVGIVTGFNYPDEEFQARYNTHQDQIAEALRQGPPPGAVEQFTATLTRAITDAGASVINAFLQQPETFRKVIAGEGVTLQEAMTTAGLMASGPLVRGYGPQPIEPEILPPLPRAQITDRFPGGIGGGTGPIIEPELAPYTHGQAEPYKPGQLLKLPPPPDMPIVDLERPLGQPPRLIAPKDAMSPRPVELSAAHEAAQELSAMPVEAREAALKGVPPEIRVQTAPLADRADTPQVSVTGKREPLVQPDPAKLERLATLEVENTTPEGGGTFFQRILQQQIDRGEPIMSPWRQQMEAENRLMSQGVPANLAVQSEWRRSLEAGGRTLAEGPPAENFWDTIRRSRDDAITQEVELSSSPKARRAYLERIVPEDIRPSQVLEPKPQELLDLAEGYDTAKSLTQHFTELLGDTSGSVSVGSALGLFKWRTPAQKAFHDAFSESRDVMQRILIPSIQRGVKNDVLLGRMMDTYRGVVAPHVNEFAKASRRGDGPAMMASEVGRFYDHYENGNWSSMGTSKLAPLADALMAIAAHGESEMMKAWDEGLIDQPTIIDYWFKHLWKDPHGPNWDNLTGAGRGWRQGDTSAQQQRTLLKMSDGLRRGISPMFDNPIDQALYGEHLRTFYNNALRAVKQAIDEGQAYWAKGPRTPGDLLLDGIAARSRVSAQQNLPLGSTGPTALEHLYAPPGFARGYNNALSQGMNAHPTSATAYNRLLWIGNATTALKLVWPGFHARVLGLASWGHAFAGAFEAVGRGQFLRALGITGKLATVVGPAAHDTWVGFRSIYRYTHDIRDPVVDLLDQSGLRMTPRQDIYGVGSESLARTAAKGGFQPLRGASLRHPLAGRWDIKGGVQEIVREIGRDIHAAAGDPRFEGPGQRMVKGLYRIPVNLPLKEAGRVMQTATSPFFDFLVPAMKAGAGYNRLKGWLDAHPFATPEEKWFAGRQIVRSIEHNFGELNQDTRFGPRMAKQIFNGALISTGWKYGTEVGFLTALGVDPERGSRMLGKWQGPKAVFILPLIGMVAGYVIINTLQQTLEYGQPAPWTTGTPMHDIINHRTGGTDKYGSPERGMDPTELKEAYDQAKIVLLAIYSPKDAPEALADYALGAFNPFWQLMRGTFSGHDAVGKSTVDRPGGYLAYVKATLGPMIWDTISDHKDLSSKLNAFDAFMGGKVASGWNTDFDLFLQRLDKYHQRNMKAEQSRENRENGVASPGRGSRSAGHGGNHTGAVGPNSPNWGR